MSLDIEKIVATIPILLEYIIPGFVTLSFYNRIREKEALLEQSKLLSCICISLLLNFCFKSLVSNIYIRVIVEIVAGCILSIIFIKIISFEFVRNKFSKLNRTTIAESVFEAIGLHLPDKYVTVFLKDGSMIYGRLIVFNGGDDSWLAIDCYRTSGPSFDDEHGKKDEWYRKEEPKSNIYHVITIPYNEIRAIAKHDKEFQSKTKRSKSKTKRSK